MTAESTASTAARLDLPSGPLLRIGLGETDYFAGKIHEVRVYRRSMAQDMIPRLARAQGQG